MTGNIDLKELWRNQESTIPPTDELIEKANNFKKSNLRKLILANVLLLLTSAFIVLVWYYYQPEMLTTKIGIVSIILAMILYLIVYNQMIPLLLKIDNSLNSTQYLQQLLRFKEKQLFLQSTMLNIYFILLSMGICMYMYEFTSQMTLAWALFSYGLTLLWMAINWFYFRPRAIKNQQTKINELIRKFEVLTKQLTTSDYK